MRNWDPYLADTLESMARAGLRRSIGVLAAAQRSYSGCLQYKENVRDARQSLAERGVRAPQVTYVGDWHEHPGFLEANAAHVREALSRIPEDLRADARLVFTAHSIPTSMAARYPYERNLRASAGRVADLLGRLDWALVYQSRSGRPEDPWLEPDICDFLRAEHTRGMRAVVLCPIGFLCDHVEVLYDLDQEAAGVAHELGLTLARAASVDTHPRFIDALADAVEDVWHRYEAGIPLTIV
jgi:ferrochelatase